MRNDQFNRVLDMMRDLHFSKASDYGATDDIYGNFRPSENYGIPAWLGAEIRLGDKTARIATFAKKGQLEHESVEDSMLDRCVYAVIVYCLYMDARERNEAGMDSGVGGGEVVDDGGEVVDSMEGTNRVTVSATGEIVFPRVSSADD